VEGLTRSGNVATIRSVSKLFPTQQLPGKHIMLTSRLSPIILLMGSLVAAGCDSPTVIEPSVVTSVTLFFASDTIEVGQQAFAKVVAVDQFGDPIHTLPVEFSSSQAAVAGIHPTAGATLGLAPGTTEITATVGGKSAKRTLTVVRSPIRINEVKPNGDGPSGWVELFNPTDNPIDISRYTITSSGIFEPFVLPEGSIIPARGYFNVEESDMPLGLRAADAVHVFSRFGVQVDAFAWAANPATSLGRCPEGTGSFIITAAPTKTRANACPVN
jgi:hypothetical protein